MRSGKATLLLGSGLAVLVPLAAAGTAGAANRIVFEDLRGGDSNIFYIKPSGDRPHQLTYEKTSDTDPAWAPKQRKMVFARSGALVVTEGDGTNKQRIRNTRFASQPAFVPDGKWIAYTRRNKSGTRSIFRIRPNGKRRKRLASGSDPAWSPDGKTIAYTSNGSIRTMRASGRRKRRLLPNASAPDWAPGGKSIAFVRDGRIWVADASGANPFVITEALPAKRRDAEPAWSPKGDRIAYAQIFQARSPLAGIHTIRPDGTGDRRIARGTSPDW
jgi:Tol biopolymer transport system component